jgi:hypothetical protein
MAADTKLILGTRRCASKFMLATVEIFVKPDFETHAEERRRFAIMNIRATYSAKLQVGRPDAVQRKIVGRCLDLRRRPNDDPRTPGCVAGFCKPDEAPRDQTAWLGM